MSIGGSKGSSDTKSTGQSTSSSTGNYTPNNLTALQAGWNIAGQLQGAANYPGFVTQGANALSAAAPGATGLNTAASGAASNFAGGTYADNPANAYLTPYANGSYVNSNNPQFTQMVARLSNALQPQIDGGFAAAGRYGSGANANAFASALTNEAGNLAYQNYGQQQTNQLNAAGQIAANDTAGRAQQLEGAALAPGLVTSSFTPAQALAAFGFGGPLSYQQLVSMGNPGGTQTNSGTEQGSSTKDTDTSKFGFGVSVPLFGSGGGGGTYGPGPA